MSFVRPRAWLSRFRQLRKKHVLMSLGAVILCAGLVSVVAVSTVHAQGAPSWVGVQLATMLAWIFLQLGSILGSVVTLLISVLLSVVKYNGFINALPVQIGWVVMRDIANLFFIVILLVIAFGTILGLEKYNYRALLKDFIVMAIAVNFSRTIVGFIIDISQVIMLTFVNGFAAAAAGNFINALRLNSLYAFNTNVQTGVSNALEAGRDPGVSALGFAVSTLGAIFLGFLITIVVFITVLAFVAVLMYRIVMLWVVTIFAPLAFFLKTFPQGEKYYAEWWDKLKSAAQAGPILAFFLWLALVISAQTNDVLSLGTVSNDSALPSIEIFGSAIGTTDSLISLLITLAILFMGLESVQKLGDGFGGIAGWASGTAKGALKYVARTTDRLQGTVTGVRVGLLPDRISGALSEKGKKWDESIKQTGLQRSVEGYGVAKGAASVIGSVAGAGSFVRTFAKKGATLNDAKESASKSFDSAKRGAESLATGVRDYLPGVRYAAMPFQAALAPEVFIKTIFSGGVGGMLRRNVRSFAGKGVEWKLTKSAIENENKAKDIEKKLEDERKVKDAASQELVELNNADAALTNFDTRSIEEKRKVKAGNARNDDKKTVASQLLPILKFAAANGKMDDDDALKKRVEGMQGVDDLAGDLKILQQSLEFVEKIGSTDLKGAVTKEQDNKNTIITDYAKGAAEREKLENEARGYRQAAIAARGRAAGSSTGYAGAYDDQFEHQKKEAAPTTKDADVLVADAIKAMARGDGVALAAISEKMAEIGKLPKLLKALNLNGADTAQGIHNLADLIAQTGVSVSHADDVGLRISELMTDAGHWEFANAYKRDANTGDVERLDEKARAGKQFEMIEKKNPEDFKKLQANSLFVNNPNGTQSLSDTGVGFLAALKTKPIGEVGKMVERKDITPEIIRILKDNIKTLRELAKDDPSLMMVIRQIEPAASSKSQNEMKAVAEDLAKKRDLGLPGRGASAPSP